MTVRGRRTAKNPSYGSQMTSGGVPSLNFEGWGGVGGVWSHRELITDSLHHHIYGDEGVGNLPC